MAKELEINMFLEKFEDSRICDKHGSDITDEFISLIKDIKQSYGNKCKKDERDKITNELLDIVQDIPPLIKQKTLTHGKMAQMCMRILNKLQEFQKDSNN